MNRSITLSHSRPMGQITVVVIEREFDISITRSEVGFFEQAPETLTVEQPFEKAVAQLTAWCAGEVIQVALSDWEVEIREWLITGNAPGEDLNPIHH